VTASPLVSVVLPTHNGSRYLRESIDSVLNQTLEDFELLIVDDASTDDTGEIIASFAQKDPRIKHFRNETNLKLPASLNAGFRKATGRYLTWTSDDNKYRHNALRRLVAALSANPDAGLVYSDYSWIDQIGVELERVHVAGREMLPFYNPVGGCFMYRREMLQAVGEYDETLFLVEDYDYWLRIARQFKLLTIADDLYCFRVHQLSLTSQRSSQIALAQERALRKNLPVIPWLRRPQRALAHLALATRTHRMREREPSTRHMTQFLILGWPLVFQKYRQPTVLRILSESAPCAAPANKDFFQLYLNERMLYLAAYAYLGNFGLAWAYRLQNLLNKIRRTTAASLDPA
jgi:GT2 family glycosyltransferase